MMNNNDLNIAHFDPLTGLSNPTLFYEELKRILAAGARRGALCAALQIEINFSEYTENSELYQNRNLSQLISERIANNIRRGDLLVRIKSNTFIVILVDISKQFDASKIAQKLLRTLSEPIEYEFKRIHLTTNIGISVFPEDGENVKTLLRNAEISMFISKDQGPNHFYYCTTEVGSKIEAGAIFEKNLKDAILKNEFRLLFQPIVNIRTQEVTGTEAYLRWAFPNGETIFPSEIIPIAEKTEQIQTVTDWVIKTTCRQLKLWREKDLLKLSASINLSLQTLKDERFIDSLVSILHKTNVSAKHLVFDISEKVILHDIAQSKKFLNALRSLGCQVAIDNLGLEHPSLNYLQLFKVDAIKINQGLTKNIATDKDNAAILATIISVAHKLNINVIAAGVETIEQLAQLRKMGCDEYQGYLFTKPLPADALSTLLKNKLNV